MRAGLLALCVGLVGCGALTAPQLDAGAHGDGGSDGVWTELSVPMGLTAPFQSLAAQPGAVFALVGEDTVLRSGGGQFELVSAADSPVVLYLAAAQSGAVAFTSFQTLFVCPGNCTSVDAFDQLSLPRTPIGLCSGAEGLAAMTTAADAGAALFVEDAGSWSTGRLLSVTSPRNCARARQGVFITEQGGVFNVETGALERVDVPGRDGALEPWRLAASVGDAVFIASDLGGAAVRDGTGVWRASAVATSDVTALAVEADDSAWLAAGTALWRFDSTAWASAGSAPSTLTTVAGLALQPGAVYVGGLDAAGHPRIFRRPR